MNYTIEDALNDKEVGYANSMWQAKAIAESYEGECEALGIPCEVQICDEEGRLLY